MGSADSSKPNSRALKGRDLITVGIFTALYFAVNFACMLLSGLHPYLWVFMPALDGLLAAYIDNLRTVIKNNPLVARYLEE